MNIPNLIVGAFFAAAAFVAFRSHQFIRSSVIVPGRVTELIAQRSSKGGTTYKIVAQFSDAAGQPHTYRAGFSSSDPGYGVGDTIRICYRENNPADCGVYSFGYRYGAAWVLACAAVAMSLILLGFRRGQEVMDRVYLERVETYELR